MQTLYEAPHAKEPNQRWCVYSHFDASGKIHGHVTYTLGKLKECGFKIAILSTSPSISEADLASLKLLATTVILRDNVGYDFGSYKLGIEYLKEIDARPSLLLITNDSVFGPLQPLEPLLEKAQNFDLFGLTDSIEFNYHLQSYFILYGQRVLNSPSFSEFWNSVELLDAGDKAFKQKIITQYEVGGSQFFLKNGFTLGSAFGFKSMAQAAWSQFVGQLDLAQQQPGYQANRLNLGYNITHYYWRELVTAGCPYIKRELLTLNPVNRDINDWPKIIASQSNYPVASIIDAVFQQLGNDDFFFTTNHTETIAQHIDETGQVDIPINPAFEPWAHLFSTPSHRLFVFDESYYLENNNDVRKSVQKGIHPSGLYHFKNHGFREERATHFAPQSKQHEQQTTD